MPKTITVSIVFNSKSKGCEAACGPDWSNPEYFDIVKTRARERFGDLIKLELVDLAGEDEHLAVMKKKINEDNLGLPLLLIDNEVRIVGEFDVRQLMDAVEVVKEIDGQ